MSHYFSLPRNILELLLERFVEPTIENWIGKRWRHSDQMTKGKANLYSFIALQAKNVKKLVLGMKIVTYSNIADIQNDVEWVEWKPRKCKYNDNGDQQCMSSWLFFDLFTKSVFLHLQNQVRMLSYSFIISVSFPVDFQRLEYKKKLSNFLIKQYEKSFFNFSIPL